MTSPEPNGALNGLRVIELASIGPGPLAAVMLADLGAEILRIERPGGNDWPNPVLERGRHVVSLDLRSDEGRELCLAAIERADVLIEGFRPGVMERLGLGPEVALGRNPRLVYGRMTGWGQTGPLAKAAGHDINYIALSGALASFGQPDTPPMPPLNFAGDFAGGSAYLAFGILAALLERERSGLGQIVDAAILDGVASMMSAFSGFADHGAAMLDRRTSMLGGAAPFYRCYECADGEYVSVGAVEAKFYAELIDRIGAPAEFHEHQNDPALWPERSRYLEQLFKAKTRTEWCALLEGTDTCFAPVLTFVEAQAHPQTTERQVYEQRDGYPHQRPAPRLSRTPGAIRGIEDGRELLARWLDPEVGAGGKG